MLNPGFLAAVSLTSAYVLADSKPGRSLLRSEGVILHVSSLYTAVVEIVKSRADLSASSPDLIWILGEIIEELGFETAPSL
jgi:hypothetical protein